MAELQTAVNDLIKGKKPEENLHIYSEGLSSLYKRMATIRLAMNYFTFAEVYLEMDEKAKKVTENSIDRIQKLINDVVILSEFDDATITEIGKFRDELIVKMEVLTAYTDRFQIIEYMLNRVEYRFYNSDFSEDYYNDKFEKDIYHYVTSDKDNAVINMKLSQIIAQVPMRLSKNKFFDMLKDALNLYKENEKQSVDDFSYMIRTAGAIYAPEEFGMYFPRLKDAYEKLSNISVDDMTEADFKNYSSMLEEASGLIEKYSDFYVMITEVLNDIYSIALNRNSFSDINEVEKLIGIISDSYDMIEGHDIDAETVSSKFTEFEGFQEKLSSQIFNPESAMDEIISVNEASIKELNFESIINSLKITSRLQSSSTFARLNDKPETSEIADEGYINEILTGLIADFSNQFENSSRYYKRAVMAMVISTLPTFFNNLEEFKKYVHVALGQCTDNAEKQACMSLINSMITSE